MQKWRLLSSPAQGSSLSSPVQAGRNIIIMMHTSLSVSLSLSLSYAQLTSFSIYFFRLILSLHCNLGLFSPVKESDLA
jgi:hypothetical protein